MKLKPRFLELTGLRIWTLSNCKSSWCSKFF